MALMPSITLRMTIDTAFQWYEILVLSEACQAKGMVEVNDHLGKVRTVIARYSPL